MRQVQEAFLRMPNLTHAQRQQYLKVRDREIVNRDGQAVVLHGTSLGGWMNMENFIIGYPATESAQRRILYQILGKAKYDLFFEKFLENFFTEVDADFIRSLGMNCLRIPVNYQHFEDDMEPFVIKESGFKHLDRVIDLCAQYNLYSVIDLHALPGFQNQDWHCDNPTHKAFFWEHRHFQDRVVHLWEEIARHYKDNPWVAGYNLINEPADPSNEMLIPVYQRLLDAIRAIDPDHILFLEGNRYSQDFQMFGEPWPNVVYCIHNYPLPGFADGGPYPGVSRGKYFDQNVLEKDLLGIIQYMLQNNVPIWVGEFGPVYSNDSLITAMRYRLLIEQLEIFTKYKINWSIWTYKDIGLQGVVYVAPDSEWIQRIRPVLEKKGQLGVDGWGGRDTQIRHILEPIEQTFAEFFPQYSPYPFSPRWYIHRLVRHILLAEPLMQEFGSCFRDLDDSEIDNLMQSFNFRNCHKRTRLAEILAQYANS
jgi:aryl-phospho-beta-D-glucosidase BglC (GH1 family)